MNEQSYDDLGSTLARQIREAVEPLAREVAGKSQLESVKIRPGFDGSFQGVVKTIAEWLQASECEAEGVPEMQPFRQDKPQDFEFFTPVVDALADVCDFAVAGQVSTVSRTAFLLQSRIVDNSAIVGMSPRQAAVCRALIAFECFCMYIRKKWFRPREIAYALIVLEYLDHLQRNLEDGSGIYMRGENLMTIESVLQCRDHVYEDVRDEFLHISGYCPQDSPFYDELKPSADELLVISGRMKLLGEFLWRESQRASCALVLEAFRTVAQSLSYAPHVTEVSNLLSQCYLDWGLWDEACVVCLTWLRSEEGEVRARQEGDAGYAASESGLHKEDAAYVASSCESHANMHATVATTLAVAARICEQLGFEETGPLVCNGSVVDNAYLCVAQILRELSLREISKARSLRLSTPLLDVSEAGILQESYRFRIITGERISPNSHPAVMSREHSALLEWDVCRLGELGPGGKTAQARNAVLVRYIHDTLDWLMEYAAYIAKSGAEADYEHLGLTHHVRLLVEAWESRARLLPVRFPYIRAYQPIISALETLIGYSDDASKCDRERAIVAVLAIERHARQVQAFLRCSFSNAGDAARLDPCLALVSQCLRNGVWADVDVDEMQSCIGLAQGRSHHAAIDTIAYYTSIDTACRLLEKMYYSNSPRHRYPRTVPEFERDGDLDDMDLTGGPYYGLTVMHASYMNDPTEGSVLLNCLEGSGGSGESVLSGLSPSEFRDRILSESFVFVKSLTSAEDALHMWSLYGKDTQHGDGSGCAVHFKGEMFAAHPDMSLHPIEIHNEFAILTPPWDDWLRLFRVAYRTDSGFEFGPSVGPARSKSCPMLVDSLTDLQACLELIEPIEDNGYGQLGSAGMKDAVVRSAMRSLAEIAFLFKDGSFQNEEEMRLIVLKGHDEESLAEITAIPRDEKVDRYCYRAHCGLWIDKVMLGPNVEDPHDVIPHFQYVLAEYAANTSLRKANLSPKVVKSAIPFQ